MDYDNKNSTTDKNVDGQLNEEEALVYAKANPGEDNTNQKLLVSSDYKADPYLSKAEINMADLFDCEYFHNLDEDVITCVKRKSEFNLVYSFADDDIVDGIAEISELVVATNELLTSIADNSQHFKRLSKDSPRMPEIKSINIRRANATD